MSRPQHFFHKYNYGIENLEKYAFTFVANITLSPVTETAQL